ncbi:hypothetical protein A2U01_0073426, partial [Trifolium medium]|nr:hypothetical protein [Trifolium medium]
RSAVWRIAQAKQVASGSVLELVCGAGLYGALRSKAGYSKNRFWHLRVAQGKQETAR